MSVPFGWSAAVREIKATIKRTYIITIIAVLIVVTDEIREVVVGVVINR